MGDCWASNSWEANVWATGSWFDSGVGGDLNTEQKTFVRFLKMMGRGM